MIYLSRKGVNLGLGLGSVLIGLLNMLKSISSKRVGLHRIRDGMVVMGIFGCCVSRIRI